MQSAKTTNVLLLILVALQLWQVSSSTPPAVAGDASQVEEVSIVSHSVRTSDPLPVVIISGPGQRVSRYNRLPVEIENH